MSDSDAPINLLVVSEQQAAAQSKQKEAGGSIAAPRFRLHFCLTRLKKEQKNK